MAAHALEIDPVSDTHYLYVAKQFLAKPLPKDWALHGDGFQNSITGEFVKYHPGIRYYQKLVKAMKNKKETLVDKVKGALEPCKLLFDGKYKKGLTACFGCDEKKLEAKKEEMNVKVEEQLQKLGKITMKMILKIDKESTKRIQASKELEYCASIIESEVIHLRESYIKPK